MCLVLIRLCIVRVRPRQVVHVEDGDATRVRILALPLALPAFLEIEAAERDELAVPVDVDAGVVCSVACLVVADLGPGEAGDAESVHAAVLDSLISVGATIDEAIVCQSCFISPLTSDSHLVGAIVARVGHTHGTVMTATLWRLPRRLLPMPLLLRDVVHVNRPPVDVSRPRLMRSLQSTQQNNNTLRPKRRHKRRAASPDRPVMGVLAPLHNLPLHRREIEHIKPRHRRRRRANLTTLVHRPPAKDKRRIVAARVRRRLGAVDARKHILVLGRLAVPLPAALAVREEPPEKGEVGRRQEGEAAAPDVEAA